MPACHSDKQSALSPLKKGLRYGLVISALLAGMAVPSFSAGFLDDLEINSGMTRIVDATGELPSLSGSFLAAQIAGLNGEDVIAIENYSRAIKLDPENIRLKQLLLRALTANGNIDEAIASLKDIPAEQRDENVNHLVVATDALKQKSWQRALTNIDKMVGADLDSMIATLVGSWALVGERKLEEAIERASGEGGPDWVDMIRQYHIGLMYASAGQDAKAIIHFNAAVEYRAIAAALTETYMRAVEGLARAKARTGDMAGARQDVADGLELLLNHPPLLALQKRLAEAGDDGRQIMPLVTSAQAGGAEVYFNIGSAIGRQGSLPIAQTYLQLARYLQPNSDEILYSLANVYEEQDRYLRANELYTQIKDTSAYYRRAQLEVGLNMNRLEKVEESLSILNALVEAAPDDLQTALSLGAVYGQHERYGEAIKVYDKSIEQIETPEPQHWIVFYRRGIGHERTKQWPLAEADFQKSLELSPNQPDVLNYLGYSWIDMGINLDEGLEMIRTAVELKPNSGFIIDSLGWAYYRLGRYEEAVTELQRALELMPSDPVINDHLGDAYWKTGRKLEAVFQWKHALANDPTEEDRFKITRKLQVGLTH